MSDFSLLSAGERDVLVMLAEGHTAKSVAEIKGLSVAAVNERLRAARRKLGAGSSRELARAFRLQLNRDEEIELPPDNDTPSLHPSPIISVGGRFLMAIATIVALTIGAMTIQQNLARSPAQTVASASPDSLLGGLIDPSHDLSTMHRRLRSEVRDETWASRTEAALRARYARVLHLVSGGIPFE